MDNSDTPGAATGASLGDHLREHIRLGNFLRTPMAPQLLTSPMDDGFRVITRLEGGWLLGLRLVQRSGSFEVVEAAFLAGDDPDAGLSTGFLRMLPLGQIIDAARAHAAEVAEIISGEAVGQLTELLAPWTSDARSTNVTRDDTAYAALAARYTELVAKGDRKPAETLGAELGMSPVTLSQRIREARQRGLLTEAPRGKPGGELTPRSYQLLGRIIT